MSALHTNDLRAQLKRLVIEAANLRGMNPDEIRDDEPLFREGLGLDSIDLLEIVVRIEKTFGLKIQNDEVGRSALRDIASLSDAIERHRQTQG